MRRRFVSIWFRYLVTDWISIREPGLKKIPFILSTPDHGRMIITSFNKMAASHGIFAGMPVADARAIFPGIEVRDDKPELKSKILQRIAEWCIRFTPVT